MAIRSKNSSAQQQRMGQSHVDAVKEKFPDAFLSAEWVHEEEIDLKVKLEDAPDVFEYLYYQRGGWFCTMAANDERPINGKFALYYILSMEEGDNCYILLHVEVPRDTCTFKAVSAKVPATVWAEREAQDMFGLHAEGIIDNRNLVLPDDWPQGLYPLRKDSMDYRYRPAPTSDLESYEFLKEVGDKETTVIPMGPLHITSDEPGHFRLFVEGEDIIDADYRMFFIHRGMEKCAESRMNYDSIPFLAERVCGICGYAHATAYSEAVERAQGIEVPLRAQYIRALVLETERLHSHLLNIGLASHYTGFDTGFNHFFRAREKSMDLAEMITGARKTYGLNLIGGVRRDILAEQKLATLKYLEDLRSEVKGLVDELLSTPNFYKRAAGVGVLDKQVARDYSPVGPLVRGSGHPRDARWNHPYDGYKALAKNHKVFTHDTCDVLARTQVRIEEVLDSMDQIQELLEADLPSGPVLNDKWTYTPHKFAMVTNEAPRGENCHFAMIGDNQKCYRWRCRAATYNNWPVLRYMFRGNTISDAALIVGSVDPCYSCTERVTIVDVKKQKSQDVTVQQLKDYARTRKHSPIEM